MTSSLTFQRIIPDAAQTKILYELLSQREHAISRECSLAYKDHESFVLKHPYRRWYLIYEKNSCIGSVYVHYDNSIGINIHVKIATKKLHQILTFVKLTLKPLKPIPSVRYKDFFLNIPIEDANLQSSLRELGYRAKQISFTQK